MTEQCGRTQGTPRQLGVTTKITISLPRAHVNAARRAVAESNARRSGVVSRTSSVTCDDVVRRPLVNSVDDSVAGNQPIPARRARSTASARPATCSLAYTADA